MEEDEIDMIFKKVDINNKDTITYSEFLVFTMNEDQLTNKNISTFFDTICGVKQKTENDDENDVIITMNCDLIHQYL